MANLASEELWQEVDDQQEWLDTLSERPGTEELRREAEESLAETLTVICALSRLHEDW